MSHLKALEFYSGIGGHSFLCVEYNLSIQLISFKVVYIELCLGVQSMLLSYALSTGIKQPAAFMKPTMGGNLSRGYAYFTLTHI
jgi:hypothetical protein